MQFARLDDLTLHYQTIGLAPGRPLLVFANSLGTDFRIWRDVVVRLAGEFGILTYDMRGHGLSDVGRTPYKMATLADDLAQLLDLLGERNAIVCGVSVGGMVAQQLAAARPELVRALVLCNTLPRMGEAASWTARIAAVEADGLDSIADTILERWFTPVFRQADNAELAGYRNMLSRQSAAGYVATCAALRDADLSAGTRRLTMPTICIAGEGDKAPTPAQVAAFAKTIPGARFEVIKACGHIPSIEQPEALVEIMRAFIALIGTETVSHVTH